MAFPSAIGCFVIGASPITSGGPCIDVDDGLFCTAIKSYLYWQYRDDDNLQAFVDSYNTQAQRFVTWFCQLDLPIYTMDPVSGALLNWVGAGLYGYPRPVLGRGHQVLQGPYNTWEFNTLRYNQRRIVGDFIAENVTDDLYRRCLTWHFFKGDGRVFNVTYLKKRIMRWLTGVDGTNPGIDQTYRISVSFGLCCQVNITLVRYRSRLVRNSRYNTFRYNTTRYNDSAVEVTIIADPFEFGRQLKEAIEQGVLELPFQYSYIIKIQ